MKIKMDKKGKVKLIAVTLIGIALILIPLILSINETNESNVTNDSQINFTDNVAIPEINQINETNTTIDTNVPENTTTNETTLVVIPTTEAIITTPIIPTIDYTTISLPYGEQEISVIIDYPNETNNCVTLNKVGKTSLNAYSTSACDGKYHEKLSTLLKQAGII